MRIGKQKTNWLLMTLLVVSVLVHAVLLVRIAGIYASKDVEYIELEMREKQPETRVIPTPPRSRNQEPPPVPQEMTPVQAKAPKTPPPPKPPAVTAARPKMVEPISAPTRITPPQQNVVAWSPPKPSAPSSSRYTTTNDYFSMVRMKIESRKRYPLPARRSHLEGKVVVRFTILADGSIRGLELARACPHQRLNEAALKAVRSAAPFTKPPLKLFNGPVPVEIGIVFELT
jgi:protein TonB